MATKKAAKKQKRRNRKRTRRPVPASDVDLPEPVFQPDADDPTVIRIGRPPLDIDPMLVFRIAEGHATWEEIAYTVGCSVDTLERRFADVIHLARTREKVSLRRLNFALAHGDRAPRGDRRKLRAPSVDMAKFLSKQILGYRDRVLVQTQEVAPTVETYLPDNGRPMIPVAIGEDAEPIVDALGPSGADDSNPAE